MSGISKGIERSIEEPVKQGNPEDNFTVADIHELEKIKDFATLKARAKALIKGKPIRRMKPEKIAYFYDRVDTLTSPMKVIKMMYDLLLAGEGLKTIGSWNSMDPNSYAKRFAEDQNTGSVIYSFDQEDPLNKSEILVLGGAGRYSFEGLRNKARKEAAQLAQDLETNSPYAFERSAYNVKQLANTLNTIKAAYAEMEQIKKRGGVRSRNIKDLEETHSTGTTVGSAGIGGGAGLGIDKSPIEKVLEKPLGEHINSPGGMGQAYRKFTPKSSGIETLNEYDDNLVNIVINNVPKGLTIDQFYPKAFSEMLYWKYRRAEKDNFLSVAKGWYDEYKQKHNMKEYKTERAPMLIKDIDRIEDLLYTLPKGLDFNKFLDVALRQYIDNKYSTKEFSDWKNKTKYLYWDAYKKAGKDKPEGVVSKIKGWFNEEDLEEEQAPMFTPEDEAKMVNANDPKSDGWRVYKLKTGGTKESAIMKGLQNEVKDDESSKGK